MTAARRRVGRRAALLLAVVVASSCASGDARDRAVATVANPGVDATAITAPADCDIEAAVREQIREMAIDFVDDQHTYGVIVAARLPGGCDVVVNAGADGRDPETRQLGTGRILIASVTKTFIAAEIMALQEDGKLDLDDTIDRWVPQVPNAANIHIGQLLTHTSGLTDNVDTAAWRNALLADPTRRYTLAEALDLAAPQATNEPGHYQYAQAPFIIAGIIIEEVTGRSLADELTQRFFEPLGMSDTTIDPDDASRGLDHGWFTLDDNGWGGIQGDRTTFDDTVARDEDIVSTPVLGVLLSATEAHGGVVSTIADVLTWGSALGDGRALGGATDDFFFRPTPISATAEEPAHTGWGTGWLAHVCPCDLENTTTPTVVFSFHDGETLGSRTMLAVDRVHGITVVIHANTREITDDALLTLAYDVHQTLVAELPGSG